MIFNGVDRLQEKNIPLNSCLPLHLQLRYGQGNHEDLVEFWLALKCSQKQGKHVKVKYIACFILNRNSNFRAPLEHRHGTHF